MGDFAQLVTNSSALITMIFCTIMYCFCLRKDGNVAKYIHFFKHLYANLIISSQVPDILFISFPILFLCYPSDWITILLLYLLFLTWFSITSSLKSLQVILSFTISYFVSFTTLVSSFFFFTYKSIFFYLLEHRYGSIWYINSSI